MIDTKSFVLLLFLTSASLMSAQAERIQKQSKSDAIEALTGMQDYIGTWVGDGEDYDGYEGADRAPNIRLIIRLRWLQNNTAVEWTSEVRDVATGKLLNLGTKIMIFDAATRDLRVVGFGHEDGVYFSNTGLLKIKRDIVVMKISETAIDKTTGIYTVRFGLRDPKTLSIQLTDFVLNGKKQDDWEILLHSRKTD